MFTIQKASQVTYIDYEYDKTLNHLHIIMGDETGYIRILDIG